MSAAPGALRRAAHAELVLLPGEFLASSSPGGSQAELGTLPPPVQADLVRLLDFCGEARELDAVFAFLQDNGTSPDAAAELLAGCTQSGLLEPADSTCASTVDGGGGADADVLRYRALRRARRYVDYGGDSVFDDDRAAMRALLAQSPPPAPEPVFTSTRTGLPHPAVHAADTAVNAVGHLLFYGFGRLRQATFLDVLDVHLKAVPSFGARHPFDAYLVVPPDEAIPAGGYGYLPSTHELCAVQASCSPNPPGVFTLQVQVVFERLQWRYRQSIAYESAVLDAGHLLGTLRPLTAELGLRLDRAHRGEPAAPQRPLVAETVAHIDLTWEGAR